MNTRNASTLLLAAALLPACAAYKIEPPAGFAVVSEHGWETRMKAQDNVGLSVRRFENVKGGTLAFWAPLQRFGDAEIQELHRRRTVAVGFDQDIAVF